MVVQQRNHLGIKDDPDMLYRDTMVSSKRSNDSFTGRLVRRMADDSRNAVKWIASRSNVELPDVGQLGGHSYARTHRPRRSTCRRCVYFRARTQRNELFEKDLTLN